MRSDGGSNLPFGRSHVASVRYQDDATLTRTAWMERGDEKMAFKVGQVVKLAHPADDCEATARFTIVEDNVDRIVIRLICDLPIPPCETVRLDDIEPS